MKNGKDYWKSVYEEFVRTYPDISVKMVDWYPSGQMEIVVKTEDNKRYIYDWHLKSMHLLCGDNDECVMDEDEWRRCFANKLNRKMRNISRSQNFLASETGISRMTISKYINGKATPSAYNLKKIADALRCSVSEFLY